MSITELSLQEKYLRLIEKELLVKGGRWIASFNVAIRNFDVARVANGRVQHSKHKLVIDSLIYGGVRSSGFVLSRAFSYMASPTYKVACIVKHLNNAKNAKWSSIIDLIRQTGVLMESMDFEWAWLLLFGEENLSSKVVDNIERHTSRTMGILYADVRKKTMIQSDSFISRRGGRIFHPKNLDKKRSRFRLRKGGA